MSLYINGGRLYLKWLSERIDFIGRYQEARRKGGDGVWLQCVAVIEQLWNGACEGGTKHTAAGAMEFSLCSGIAHPTECRVARSTTAEL